MATGKYGADFVVVGVDWWSRLFALGSLLVSAAALGWTYLQFQDTRTVEQDQLPLVKAEVDNGLKAIREEFTLERNRWSTGVSDSLGQLRDATSSAIASVVANKPASFEEPISPPSESKKDQANPPTTGSQAADTVQPPATEGLTDTQAGVPGAPRLVKVRNTARARDLADLPTLTVRNEGSVGAQLTAIRFEPLDVIDRVPVRTARPVPDHQVGWQLEVAFQEDDNLDRATKTQGVYSRILNDPFDIPADGIVDLDVYILNKKFRGHGLLGTLTLRYDNDQVVTFDNVSVPFLVPPPSTPSGTTSDAGGTAPATSL